MLPRCHPEDISRLSMRSENQANFPKILGKTAIHNRIGICLMVWMTTGHEYLSFLAADSKPNRQSTEFYGGLPAASSPFVSQFSLRGHPG